jgi:hypothetical protein
MRGATIMGRKFLTELGGSRKQLGNEVIDTVELSVKYIHDILLLAAKKGMDVWMTCGSLNSYLRDRYTRTVTGGVTFAQSVREVLESGGNVSILLWNRLDDDEPFSRELARLLADLKEDSSHGRGMLKILATGSPDGWKNVSHFVAAADDSRQSWYLRVEQPHDPLAEKDLLNDRNRGRIPAAAMFGTREAINCGKSLLAGFDKIFNAADERVQKEQAAGIHYVAPT